MISKISFGSMFNPERVGRRNIEDGAVNSEHNLERLNAHQAQHCFGVVGMEPIEHMDFGKIDAATLELFVGEDFSNPEINIEKLKYGQESEPSKAFSTTPQELFGRSQVVARQNSKPIMLDDEDKELLTKLDSKKYGFYATGNGFWVHSKDHDKNGADLVSMGDGKLQYGTSRADFIKEQIDENVQAFNIAGVDKHGEGMAVTFIFDKATGVLTMYSSDSDKVDKVETDDFNTRDFINVTKGTVDEFETIYGATIWQ